MICACTVGADGLTPFWRVKERKFGTPLAGFGECLWLRDPVLERVNKFNPRCTEARLHGFCLKSSRYIVVDFDGRFRMVRTVKRANGIAEMAIAMRPTAWMVHNAAQVICACMVGVDGLTQFQRLKGRKFGERVWLRDPVLEKVNKFNPRCTEARLLGFCLNLCRHIVADSSYLATLWLTLTGFRMESQRRRQLESCVVERPVSQPPICSQHQLNSRAQEELEEKAILLRNVWRNTRLTHPHPIQIMTLFREGCVSRRKISWHMGRRITVRDAKQWLVVVVYKATLSNVESALKDNSGKPRRGEPVFALQPVQWGEAPTGRALKRVRFAENRVDDSAEIPQPMSVSASSTLLAEASSSSTKVSLFFQRKSTLVEHRTLPRSRLHFQPHESRVRLHL